MNLLPGQPLFDALGLGQPHKCAGAEEGEDGFRDDGKAPRSAPTLGL